MIYSHKSAEKRPPAEAAGVAVDLVLDHKFGSCLPLRTWQSCKCVRRKTLALIYLMDFLVQINNLRFHKRSSSSSSGTIVR